MQMPSVVHPKNVELNGYTFQIVSYCQLTDGQALHAVIGFCRTHKLKKKDKGKLIQVITTIGTDTASFFG